MTEFDIQKALFERFKKLNDFSGIDFLEIDADGNYTNVHFPNIPFTSPENKRYFELTFKNDEPVDNALMADTQNRFTGVFYIDVITPQDAGEYEAENKYSWIAKLFRTDELVDVYIMNIYISTKENEADHYRLLIAIEWTADIDKE